MSTPESPAVAANDLAEVRTAADAATWLDRRATEYLAQAKIEASPDHARGLRLAGSTLQAVAVVCRLWRNDVDAAEGLTNLARSYPGLTTADLPRQMRYYELACEFIALALGQVASQLTHATAPQRARRTAIEGTQRPTVRGRDL